MKKIKFNRNTTIGEVMQKRPDLEDILLSFGMHCCGCPMAQMETIEEAAKAHNIDIDILIYELNNN